MALVTTFLTGNYDPTDATSYTTASISPTANTTLYLFYSTREATTAPDLQSPTGVSGITWTKKTSQVDGISLIGVYEGVVGGSPGTGTLTLSTVGGVTAIGCSWHIIQVAGADQAAPTVQNPVGATGSTGTSSSVTYSAAGAAANRFFSFHFHRANEATTPRTNWTELDDRNGTGPNIGSELQWRDDGTNETTGSASWTTSSRWQALGVEVKAATAGTVDLAGQSDGTSSDSGDMILNLVLNGQADGVSTATGDMTLNFLVLNGTSDGLSTTTGDLSILGLVSLDGSSDGSSSDSGDMVLNLALNGQTDGLSDAVGSLSLQVLIAGQSDGTSTASATTLTEAPLEVISVMMAAPRFDMLGRKISDYTVIRKVGRF